MATSADRPASSLEREGHPSARERRLKVDSEDVQEAYDKLREAQALYEKYVELAAVGERAVLDRLASAAAERGRVEYTTHHSSASTLRSMVAISGVSTLAAAPFTFLSASRADQDQPI